MTYPATGSGPSVPAGGTDRRDLGPTIEGDGITVPRAVYHDGGGYQTHRGRDDSATSVPIRDTDGDDGLPDIPRYEGPAVSDADNALPAPLVNPSAGDVGPTEAGMDDVNPQGPAVVAGDVPGTAGPQAPDNPQQWGTGYTR